MSRVPVNASGGQGTQFPAPSNWKKRVAPDLIRGLVPTTHRRLRNSQIQMPAAQALSVIAAIAAAPQAMAQTVPAAPADDPYCTPDMVKCEKAVAVLELRIGTDGRVKDCRIQETDAAAALNAKACEITTERARFTPKRENGKPVEFTRNLRFVYVVHGEEPPKPASGTPAQ